MRVMLIIKGDPQPGAAPSEELLGAIGRYNDELKEAGVLIDLAGLLPSAMGRRVRASSRTPPPVLAAVPDAKDWTPPERGRGSRTEWATAVPSDEFPQPRQDLSQLGEQARPPPAQPGDPAELEAVGVDHCRHPQR